MNSQFHYRFSPPPPGQAEDAEEFFHHGISYFRTERSTSKESHDITVVHIHNYIQLWYVLRGGFRHVWCGKEFYQREGDFIIVPPLFSHQIDTRNATDIEFVYCELGDDFLSAFPENQEKSTLFNLTYLRPILCNAEKMNPQISLQGEIKYQVGNLFLRLVEEYTKSNELSTHYLRSLTMRILSLVAQQYEKSAPPENDLLYSKYRKAIQDALDYIEEHFTENIPLAEISRIALMSTRSFSYVFKEITGKTFLEYVHFLRIHRAVVLLRDTDCSVTDACIQCGFCDITYFGKIFKKITGVSPRTYRKLKRMEREDLEKE